MNYFGILSFLTLLANISTIPQDNETVQGQDQVSVDYAATEY